MSFIVKHSYPEKFTGIINHLLEKYGEEAFNINGIGNDQLDTNEYSKKFFRNSANGNVADASVDGNANVGGKNICHYHIEHGKSDMRLNSIYLIWKYMVDIYDEVEAEKALEMIINGSIAINDLHLWNTSYCYAFDLNNLLEGGMNFFEGDMKIGAPKRLSSFVYLMIQLTASLSNQISGAVSYPNFFLVFDYFLRKEYGDEYMTKYRSDVVFRKEINNIHQSLIYSFNFPFRGNQSAFVNLSVLDKPYMNFLFGGYVYPDFTLPHMDSIYDLQKGFFEYFNSINMKEGVFTFPVMTLGCSHNDDGVVEDPEFFSWAMKNNYEKSTSNILLDRPNSFSSCCRLRNEFDALNGLGMHNSFGVGGISIGSTRVVVLNLPKLVQLDNGYGYKDGLEMCRKLHTAHRKLLDERIEAGNLPLYTSGWIKKENQYCTIGFIGMYEAMINLDQNIVDTQKKPTEILEYIEKTVDSWGDEWKYNVEQIPGESVAIRLAELDKITGYNKHGFKLYSNQYLPLTENVSIMDRIKLQGVFDKNTSGGAILHINIDDEKLSLYQYTSIVKECRKHGVKYVGINVPIAKCENGHYVKTKGDICKICHGKIVEKYLRVVGFTTAVSRWSSVRREFEYPRRVFYDGDTNIV